MLAISYQNDGDFREHSGDGRGALESFRRKAAIDEELLAADPANAQAHGDLGYSLQRLGDLLAQSGENSEALAHYRKSEQLYSKGSPTTPDDSGLRLRIALSRAGAARSEARLGERSAALERNRQTIALLDKTADDPASADQRGLRAQVYTYLGETYVALATSGRTRPLEAREHWSAAREMFRRSFAIWEDMRTRGILSVTDAKKPAEAARELARCSDNLRERASISARPSSLPPGPREVR
jgi:tetratricopeptide (TPR) repeat protein